MNLSTQQNSILEKIKEFLKGDCSVFILKGYAGTGKTTMIQHIYEYARPLIDVRLMAPTGRAARVLTSKLPKSDDVSDVVATTIHRGIYSYSDIYSKMMKEQKYKFDDDLLLCYEISEHDDNVLVIIDEASMISSRKSDQEIFHFGSGNLLDDILTFVKPKGGGKVIFVGDPAQLPPVGDSQSNALNKEFFESKGLSVMEAELTEVLRQSGESTILKNAMKIRDLLHEKRRNRLVFDDKPGEVEYLAEGEFLPKFLKAREDSNVNDCVAICFSNAKAAQYNKEIREHFYGNDSRLHEGEILMVVHNNYSINRMNGEFIPVLSVGAIESQSAPVYVDRDGQRIKVNITLNFQSIITTDGSGKKVEKLLLLDLLYNDHRSITIDEMKALYINFCMRHPSLQPYTAEFARALIDDPYYNAIQAKFGYAITGHKCQGGEWSKAFVDYSGRTGLSDDCLRWAYTSTTRASKTLYVANLPKITPFSKFRIDPVQLVSKMNEECRHIKESEIGISPFHQPSSEKFLHAKCLCIMKNLEQSPYKITGVESKPYQEIYMIHTPDGPVRFDIRYKKGGIFSGAAPAIPNPHTPTLQYLLDDEKEIPLDFQYVPSNAVLSQLYNVIRSAADESLINITNVVEHLKEYHVCYYFRSSGVFSCLKVFIDGDGFVTYALPSSLKGAFDTEFCHFIECLNLHFD